MSRRLFIIANRLPVTVNLTKENVNVQTSSGGLVSAISGYLRNRSEDKITPFTDTFWIGIAGCGAGVWQKATPKIDESNFKFLPVFIAKKAYDHYYNGFANSVLWPLFHYFPSFVDYNEAYFENYIAANKDFLDVVVKNATHQDVIWIHDYHLMPLANMIREAIPGVTIGFFLHIPFPSYELFRMMPVSWQECIMRGLLGADMIGFHTIDYASHFLTCAQMVLGMDHEMHILRHENRLIKVDVFPISIDYDLFFNAYGKKEVVAIRNSLHKRFHGQKVIFSVDRLDYTKGVHNRLKAFEHFLTQYPEYLEKVVFVLVTVPSRGSISKYAERKKMIDEFVGHINSSVGTIHWQPIVYQYSSLSFDDLAAMYGFCDVALITPLRDGMNLVAKEFVASRQDRKGVLILSDMAGAARELTDALLINPNDLADIAVKIRQGMEMSESEQEDCMTAMQTRIKQYDVNAWADDFLSQLFLTKEKQKEFEIKFVDATTNGMLINSYNAAKKRIFLLDYDGTLIPFSATPELAVPGHQLLDLLDSLAQQDENTVFVISGRDSRTLDQWFGNIPINLIAEHGAKIRVGGNAWQNEVESHAKWKAQIVAIMELYVKRCVNSFVEQKDQSVAWHYRNANPDQGKLRAAELHLQLEGYISNLGLQVIMGNKVIEVRTSGINKGNAAKKVLKDNDFDFILACGDDTTDEDMFRELATLDHSYTIKIGPDASFAKYNLDSPSMVLSLLRTLDAQDTKKKSKHILS